MKSVLNVKLTFKLEAKGNGDDTQNKGCVNACYSLGLCADDILKYKAQSCPQTSAPVMTIETFLVPRLVIFFSLENM